MYETVLARYRAQSPGVHVILLFGHARGFAENVVDPDRANSPDGLPNFVVATPAHRPYAPTDQGGFTLRALSRAAHGDVQFAVQPVLASNRGHAPSAALARTGTSATHRHDGDRLGRRRIAGPDRGPGVAGMDQRHPKGGHGGSLDGCPYTRCGPAPQRSRSRPAASPGKSISP